MCKIIFMSVLTLTILFTGVKNIEANPGDTCNYHETSCFPLGCVPVDTTIDRDIIDSTTECHCDSCREDSDCGGAKCDPVTRLCEKIDPSPTPVPVWPHFNLLTGEIAFSSHKDFFTRPVTGVGFLFQGALKKTQPEQRPDGSWVTSEVPRVYFHTGICASLNGDIQNIFADIGISYYTPATIVTTYTVECLYQRNGERVLDVKDNGISDKIGTAFLVGFVQNLYLRVGYLWTLDNNQRSTPHISIIYMRDLFSDLLPDRFQKFLKKQK